MSDDPQLDQLDQLDAPTPASPAPSPADDDAGPGWFAVYDKDHQRFRGSATTRKAANELKRELSEPKGVRASRFEVREV